MALNHTDQSAANIKTIFTFLNVPEQPDCHIIVFYYELTGSWLRVLVIWLTCGRCDVSYFASFWTFSIMSSSSFSLLVISALTWKTQNRWVTWQTKATKPTKYNLILPVWWLINTWLNSRNTILLLKMGRKERAKAVSRSLLSTSISRRARCSYKGLSMTSFTHQLVYINDVLPALLTHLLKQSKIQTFHQVSVLHVTSQELGLLDQLTPFLCCWLITENGH